MPAATPAIKAKIIIRRLFEDFSFFSSFNSLLLCSASCNCRFSVLRVFEYLAQTNCKLSQLASMIICSGSVLVGAFLVTFTFARPFFAV